MRFWPRRNGHGRKTHAIDAFIDEGSEIEGKYVFRGTVMLNGRLTGQIESADTLIVGEKGVVNASIRAGTVVVHGEVVGTVQASERIELRGRARVVGDMEAPVVVVEEGVTFDGHCRTATAAEDYASRPTALSTAASTTPSSTSVTAASTSDAR